MKIAILSDTHGNYQLAVKIVSSFTDLTHIIHLGDTISDAEYIESALGHPIIKVAGNCDTTGNNPREMILNLGETRMFLTHGDCYSVKEGLDMLLYKSARENAGIAMYGHTHVPSVLQFDTTLLVNPGCLKEAAAIHSIAILSIENSVISAEIVTDNSLKYR
jgi:putative phosphoesterase